MKLLLKGYNEEERIDIFEMCDKIDDVFHTHITEVNGYTISHDTIRNFILTIINEINEDIQLKRNTFNKAAELEKAERDLIEKQIECGQVVINLDTWINRIKYKYAGYVLDTNENSILYKFQP
ncbi:hypothetical protein GQ473_04620 [archaeon]|nr:hypothetical protein [archaeon]